MQKMSKGFTLVELLVAVGIIGILASVSIVSVNSVRAKARDAKRISDIKQVQNALEAFYSNNNSYPFLAAATTIGVKDTTDALCNDVAGVGFVANKLKVGTTCVDPVFMTKVNPDPGITLYQYQGLEDDGVAACDAAKSCPKYKLTFTLEGGTGSLAKDGHTATQDGIQ